MPCHPPLAGLLAITVGAQAFDASPMQWCAGCSRKLVLTTDGFLNKASPLKMMSPEDSDGLFPNVIPEFKVNPDKTISWGATNGNWCIEAAGRQVGDLVRLNLCDDGANQKWDWLPRGRGRNNKIQLAGSKTCLDVIDNGGVNGALVELQECEDKAAAWSFERPTPFADQDQSHDRMPSSSSLQHVMFSFIALAALGVMHLGALFWRWRTQACDVISYNSSTEQGGVSLVAQSWASKHWGTSEQPFIPAVMASAPLEDEPAPDFEVEPVIRTGQGFDFFSEPPYEFDCFFEPPYEALSTRTSLVQVGGVFYDSAKLGVTPLSKGDVVYNAVVHAISCALRLPDISVILENLQKGASTSYMNQARELLKNRGYRISNLDVDLITYGTESKDIENHVLAGASGTSSMLQNLAALLDCGMDKVNVKVSLQKQPYKATPTSNMKGKEQEEPPKKIDEPKRTLSCHARTVLVHDDNAKKTVGAVKMVQNAIRPQTEEALTEHDYRVLYDRIKQGKEKSRVGKPTEVCKDMDSAWVIVFNAGTESEGMYSIQGNPFNHGYGDPCLKVDTIADYLLGFETREDAQRYVDHLTAQDFENGSVRKETMSRITAYCDIANVDVFVVSKDTILVPPPTNSHKLDGYRMISYFEADLLRAQCGRAGAPNTILRHLHSAWVLIFHEHGDRRREVVYALRGELPSWCTNEASNGESAGRYVLVFQSETEAAEFATSLEAEGFDVPKPHEELVRHLVPMCESMKHDVIHVPEGALINVSENFNRKLAQLYLEKCFNMPCEE